MFERFNILGSRLIARYAPDVAKQALLSIFKKKEVTPDVATGWVKQDLQLWEFVGEEHRKMLQNLARTGTSIDWFTCDWVIDTLKPDYPDVAGLFEEWDEGRHWLEQQITVFRARLS